MFRFLLALPLLFVAPAATGGWAAEIRSLDPTGFEQWVGERRGKVVIVNFWATWCPPCKWEIPAFVEMHGKYRKQGVEILGVSLDTDVDRVKKFVRKHKVTYPVSMGTLELKKAHNVVAIPVTLLYSREGEVAYRHDSYEPPKVIESEIRELLGQE